MAPCTLQPPSVVLALRLLVYFLPALSCSLAALCTLAIPIDQPRHAAVMTQLRRMHRRRPACDPLNHKQPLPPPPRADAELAARRATAHFAAIELRLARRLARLAPLRARSLHTLPLVACPLLGLCAWGALALLLCRRLARAYAMAGGGFEELATPLMQQAVPRRRLTHHSARLLPTGRWLRSLVPLTARVPLRCQ